MYSELLMSLQAPLLGPMGGGARPETIYIDMMKSRHIRAKLIEEFDMFEVYGVSLIEDALAELQSHTGFTLLENGVIIVNFEDRDPERAAPWPAAPAARRRTRSRNPSCRRATTS